MRNVGIDKANGEYLCFVDSDDWLNVDYFQKAVPVLKRIQPKLLMNNYVKENGEGHVICKFSPSPDLYLDGNWTFYEMANGCKRVRFDENIIYGEDLYFLLSLLRRMMGCICIIICRCTIMSNVRTVQ